MSIKLNYEFYKEPDQLIIEDQNGNELSKMEKFATKGMLLTREKLDGVTKLH